MMETAALPGLRDFPPEEFRVREWLFGKWRETSRLFGFQEYDAALVEPQELYTRKAGEDITSQMFAFEDKEKRRVALRPEMTPSLARLVLQKGDALVKPIRWFSIPQCWRFEDITRGRKREHYQWNMDVWGVRETTAEAELLAAMVHFFRAVGFTSEMVRIRVSSRKIVQCIMDHYKVDAKQFAPACVVVDKMDKLAREEVLNQLVNVIGIPDSAANAIIDALGASTTLAEMDVRMKDMPGGRAALAEVEALFSYAEAYGYADWLLFDPSVVRGLSYYTGIVFEGFAARGELRRAVCGGGRYDRLMSVYGAPDCPAAGFGFGDCVILELLEQEKLLPTFACPVQDIVVPFNDGMRTAAITVAQKLRGKGRSVELWLATSAKPKLGPAYSYADRIGAERVVLVAPDEWVNGQVKVKLLRVAGLVQLDKIRDESLKSELAATAAAIDTASIKEMMVNFADL